MGLGKGCPGSPLGARTSGPHAPRHSATLRLNETENREDMRAGGPRTQGTEPL